MSIYIGVDFLKDQIYSHPNISVVVSVTSLLLWLAVRRPSDIPPNPWFIFPIIGHRPLIRGDPLAVIRRLRKEFGDVFSVYVDAQLVIVVSGLSAIKEAFDIRGSEFHWRPNTRTCDLFHFGIICNSGKEWREQRGVTEAGIATVNPNISVLTRREASHLASTLKEQKDATIDTSVTVSSAVFNALSSVIFSRRIDYNDVRLQKAIERFKENTDLFSDTKFPNFFPFQKFLMGDFFDVKYLRINMAEVHQKIITPVFEEHKTEFNEDKVVDFLDVYLREIKKNQNKDETTVNERSCQAVLYDMLWHATCVTSATIQWALVFLIRHPEIASSLQSDIDQVFSKAEESKKEGEGDKSKKVLELPVSFHAFIKEVQRCANVSPWAMAHAVAKEKFLKGYRIPGDAVILPNLDSLMMDADIWGDPLTFRPERFINAGKLSVPTEFIPFFVGVRNCPGSHIGQTILGTFLATILYNFNLHPAVEGQMPSTQRKKGLVPMPPDFKVKIESRR